MALKALLQDTNLGAVVTRRPVVACHQGDKLSHALGLLRSRNLLSLPVIVGPSNGASTEAHANVLGLLGFVGVQDLLSALVQGDNATSRHALRRLKQLTVAAEHSQPEPRSRRTHTPVSTNRLLFGLAQPLACDGAAITAHPFAVSCISCIARPDHPHRSHLPWLAPPPRCAIRITPRCFLLPWDSKLTRKQSTCKRRAGQARRQRR